MTNQETTRSASDKSSLHPYTVTIRSPHGRTRYNAIAINWFQCFLEASAEFGGRAVICVKPA